MEKIEICLDDKKLWSIERIIINYIQSKTKDEFELLYMPIQKIKKKLIFLGDINSINIELIIKSFSYLKSKVDYVLFCNKKDLENNFLFKKSKIKLNEIYDPYKFLNYDKNKLNIYKIENKSKKKYINLLNQIKICNNIANITKYDLVTMPVNKSILKKNSFYRDDRIFR